MKVPSFVPLDHRVPPGYVEKSLSFRRDMKGKFKDVTGLYEDQLPDSVFEQDPLRDGARRIMFRSDPLGRLRRYDGIVRRLPAGAHPDLKYVVLRRLLPEHLEMARLVAATEHEMQGHYDVE